MNTSDGTNKGELTSFDRALIQKAEAMSRYCYRKIDVLIEIADTPGAKARLSIIQQDKLDAVKETI